MQTQGEHHASPILTKKERLNRTTAQIDNQSGLGRHKTMGNFVTLWARDETPPAERGDNTRLATQLE